MSTGDIFLVNFDPAVGHEYKKIRPAVVIQSNNTLKKTALVTIMPITSQLTNSRDEDIKIEKTSGNSLFCDSAIKVGCIHSFDKQRFLKKIGQVSEETMSKILNYLRIHFDL